MEIVKDLPGAVEKGLVHENYRHNDPLLPQPMIDSMISAEAYAEGAKTFARSFPDQRTEPLWILTDGDKSACRWVWYGTFTGEPFNDLNPNGKEVTFVGMTMFRWENGQVVEGMTLYDVVGFQRQLQD